MRYKNILIVLALFVVLSLASGYPYLQKIPELKKNTAALTHLRTNIKQGSWSTAQQEIDKISVNWSRVRPRAELISIPQNRNNMTNDLAKLKAAVESKDKSSALIWLSSTQEDWQNIYQSLQGV